MKKLLTLTCLLITGAALATERVPVPTPSPQQQQQMMGGSTISSPNSDHRAYSLPSWGGGYGTDLTVCGTGWFWGIWWGPDKECIELVFKLRALQVTPAPQQPVVIYTTPSTNQDLLQRSRKRYYELNAEDRGKVGANPINECSPQAKKSTKEQSKNPKIDPCKK